MSNFSKADLHIHTTYSDGNMTPEEVVRWAAERTNLRVIAVTDHNTVAGGMVARAYRDRHADRFPHLEVIVGQEVMSEEADIVGLFLKHDIPQGLSAAESIARIHQQGGLAIAAHPFTMVSLVMNGMRGAGMKIRRLPFDAVEAQHASPTEVLSNQVARLVNRSGQRLPETGSSDAHFLSSVGSAYTLFPGASAVDLRRALESGAVRPAGFYYSPMSLARIAAGKIADRVRQRRKAPANT
ncbi:MAG: PHP domain-containing protein [Anaerolineae bacterium]|nr:PHP domain-containing protein [Anaerolineae bacterium]